MCRLALQILTLFPSNTYEVKVKVNGVTPSPPPPPLGIFYVKKCTLGPFIRGKIILDEMCRLYGKFASYFSWYKWPYYLIINLVTIKHVKRRQPLSDVFESSVLRFSIVSFKRCYDEYLLELFGVLLHFLLKFKSFADFFPSKT